MSEKAHGPQHHEAHSMTESVEKALEQFDSDKLEKAEADAKEHSSAEKLKEIHHAVETQAISGKEMTPAETHKDVTPSVGYINKELKEISYQRSLTNVRRHLSAPSRAFSKVIHQPAVDKVSEVAGATIARPSGIIGGGICAVLGSSMLLYITKKYGYEYNYLIFILLFVGGFAAGMIIELCIHMLLRKKAD